MIYVLLSSESEKMEKKAPFVEVEDVAVPMVSKHYLLATQKLIQANLAYVALVLET